MVHEYTIKLCLTQKKPFDDPHFLLIHHKSPGVGHIIPVFEETTPGEDLIANILNKEELDWGIIFAIISKK